MSKHSVSAGYGSKKSKLVLSEWVFLAAENAIVVLSACKKCGFFRFLKLPVRIVEFCLKILYNMICFNELFAHLCKSFCCSLTLSVSLPALSWSFLSCLGLPLFYWRTKAKVNPKLFSSLQTISIQILTNVLSRNRS